MARTRRGDATARQVIRRMVTVVAGVLIAVTVMTGCVGQPPEVAVDDPELTVGRSIYRANCVACHGVSGGGGTGPKLADGAVVEAYPLIDDQIEFVANGKGQMPAYQGRLDDGQLRAVVRYTREVL